MARKKRRKSNNQPSPTATIPPSEALEPPSEAHQPTGTRVVEFALAAALVLAFCAAVYAYNAFGGPFVDSISGRYGEFLMDRAAQAEERGDRKAAIAYLRQSLRLDFHDPQEHRRAIHWLADLIEAEQRPTEAAAIRELVNTLQTTP